MSSEGPHTTHCTNSAPAWAQCKTRMIKYLIMICDGKREQGQDGISRTVHCSLLYKDHEDTRKTCVNQQATQFPHTSRSFKPNRPPGVSTILWSSTSYCHSVASSCQLGGSVVSPPNAARRSSHRNIPPAAGVYGMPAASRASVQEMMNRWSEV